MRSHARALDQQDAFPAADLAALREAGVLRAPLPRWAGGLGLGTEPEGGAWLFALLRQLGAGSLAVGRIIEGHVNALQLICRYGEDAHIVRAASDAEQGHLFAIWNTEPPPGVRLSESGRLIGQKFHVSAAGYATRPLITVDHPNRSRLLLLSLKPGERATLDPHSMHGMRATQSGAIDLTGYHPQQGDWIGQDGDYLREPIFSAGAWRALAVMVGGITALVDELRGQLRARGRDAAPHQAARIAGALIAQETAALWARKAAVLAESGNASPADITGYVALARRAVERAAQEAIALTQCALGLAALMEGNPAEGLMRDLATYLRQPALDEALDEAAAHYAATPLPDAP
jgi:alkylation response protein AidB-like acyl-CoA dehydrogenase